MINIYFVLYIVFLLNMSLEDGMLCVFTELRVTLIFVYKA